MRVWVMHVCSGLQTETHQHWQASPPVVQYICLDNWIISGLFSCLSMYMCTHEQYSLTMYYPSCVMPTRVKLLNLKTGVKALLKRPIHLKCSGSLFDFPFSFHLTLTHSDMKFFHTHLPCSIQATVSVRIQPPCASQSWWWTRRPL